MAASSAVLPCKGRSDFSSWAEAAQTSDAQIMRADVPTDEDAILLRDNPPNR